MISAKDPTADPASASPLKRLMARYPVASFFVLMCLGVWVAYLPLLIAQNGFGLLPFEIPVPAVLFNLPASILGPLFAGFIMARITGGKDGVRQMRARLFQWRVGIQWYVLPLVAVPAIGLLSAAAALGLQPLSTLAWVDFLTGYLLTSVIIALIVNMWEEGGLVGFAQPHLQQKYGAIAGSLILAPLWAFMHLPAFFIPEMGVGLAGPLTLSNVVLGLLVMVGFAIPVRIIATWLFNNTGQSVVIVALFHAAMNSTQSQLGNMVPNYNTFYLIGGLAVVSVALIAITKGRLAYSQDHAARATDTPQLAATPFAR